MNDGGEDNRFLLKGIVIPVDWDHSGTVRTVEILTDDETEFEVAPGGADDQLKIHIRREILAEAVLLSSAGHVKRVRVDAFALLDWAGPEGSIIATRP